MAIDAPERRQGLFVSTHSHDECWSHKVQTGYKAKENQILGFNLILITGRKIADLSFLEGHRPLKDMRSLQLSGQ